MNFAASILQASVTTTNSETPNKQSKNTTMKQIQTAFKSLTVIALAVLAVGCASELQDKENLAVAAGFKVITPSTPSQNALLKKLPKDKVTLINQGGKRIMPCLM